MCQCRVKLVNTRITTRTTFFLHVYPATRFQFEIANFNVRRLHTFYLNRSRLVLPLLFNKTSIESTL